MITIQSQVHVEPGSCQALYNFMINPTDAAYQNWWPGTHLEFHNLRSVPGHIGNLIYMDEYVGQRRLRMAAVVTEAEPGRKITWRFQKFMRLPIWLCLELEEAGAGVVLTHTLKAGFTGAGQILDVFFRLYLSEAFARAMDEHAHIEFPRLGQLLSAGD